MHTTGIISGLETCDRVETNWPCICAQNFTYTYILVIKSLFKLCNLINIKPSFIRGRVLGVHFTQMCIMHLMEKLFGSYAAKFWLLRFFMY